MSAQVPAMVEGPPTDSPHDYAMRLAWALWEKHWKDDAPDWQPLPDLLGLLTQIDNMVAGLVRKDGQTGDSKND